MRTLIVTALCGIALFGQDLRTVRFGGIINDYTPADVSGGPWELRGNWNAEISPSGTASFTADLTMQTSDYGITDPTQVDPNNPSTRTPHTHHISVTGATVSYDMTVCPANSPGTPPPAREWSLTGQAPRPQMGAPRLLSPKALLLSRSASPAAQPSRSPT